MKYWITVVSKDHIARGVAGGFMQANHGKQGPLTRMATGDWVIIYSPRQSMDGNERLQAFTAIGRVAGDEIYQYKMSEDFKPFRRNVTYYQCKETPIVPLVEDLSFMPNKTSWGYPFRFGFFELPGHDFELIKKHMLADEPIPVNNK
jgi:hypothetical protein